jgi:hypothetical protein
MTKSIELKNTIHSSVNKENKIAGVKPLIYRGLGALLIGAMVLPEIASAGAAAEAGNANLENLATGFFTPLIAVLNNHWGKAILLVSSGSAVIGEGDLRQRGIRALIGGGVSGAAITALVGVFG